MGLKTWAIVIVVGMLALAIVGLLLHSDRKLISADFIGAVAAVAVVVLASRGSAAILATRTLGILALLIIAILSLTAQAAPWLTALTLAGSFALTFMTWTSMSRTEPRGPAQRPRPTSAT
jgi:hypothetical protein